MSDLSAKIKVSKEKENKMKISKFARQNYILVALSVVFGLIANACVSDVATNGVMGFGMFGVIFASFALLGSLSALVIRLWDMD
jgi:hypothetical protein